MKKRPSEKKVSISAVIPLFNASNTLVKCLDSLFAQSVHASEILLVDNKSTDNSLEIIKRYATAHPQIPISVITKEKTSSVASSYNLGLKKSTGTIIVGMHSDSTLPTKEELAKLVQPLLDDAEAVGTYSYVVHPQEIWDTYNFWEKCQHARLVEKKISGMNGKFDCYRKDALLKLHGFDDVNFDKYGDGNDADIYYRLKTIGKVLLSDARVVHLHHLKHNYSLWDWMEKRRNMSITSARLLRMHLGKTDVKGLATFTIRPLLAFLSLVPGFNMLGIMGALLFSLFYTPRMYATLSNWSNPRILLLPFVNFVLVYFEAFWFVWIFATHKVKYKISL